MILARFPTLPSGLAVPALVAVAIVSLPATGLAFEKTVRWTHPAPETVAEFIVHVGNESRKYNRKYRVGVPVPNASGVFESSIEIPDGGKSFIAVSAVGFTGLRSRFSNERKVRTDASPGGGDGGDDGALGAPGAPFVVSP